ncbi:AtuA-related protein [Tardiphaga sp. 813_E8_N1_3]|uniref:AtuA-related protein n=1 Tax=Tardiphaga sp. 813_E8_N1_3 TaxID=3240760 RepID=UPI003F27169B
MKLHEIAHSRSGDKGDTSNISVVAFDADDFAHLVEHVTADRVARHFGDTITGTVARYELPALGALNFVLTGALGGGVVRSLALDTHGKSMSSALLEFELPSKGASSGSP